jgi:uncharacterized protein YjeT (DUF2065 family)
VQAAASKIPIGIAAQLTPTRTRSAVKSIVGIPDWALRIIHP